MSASVLQVAFVDDAFGSGTTLATPSTGTGSFGAACTVGSGIEVWATCSADGTPPALTDSAGQSYGVPKASSFNAGFGNQAVFVWTLDSNASATKLTHTITYGTAQTGKGIFVKEIAGPVAFNNAGINLQPVPGAGANVITSGTITPTVVNTFLSAISMEVFLGNGSNLAAGTNYALNAAVFWKFGGATVLAKAEERTTLLGTLTATAATYTDATNGASGTYVTGLVMWAPASGISGSGAPTEGHDTVAGTGASSVSGSAAITEPHDTAAGTGAAPIAGSGAIAEPHDTVAGSGSTSVAGSGAAAEAHDAVAGSGSTGASISGSGAITEPADTVAGTGSTSDAGSGAAAEAHDTIAGSGGLTDSGSAAIAEGHDTLAGAGLIPPQLTAWRTAMAGVRAGSRRARLLVIGDSLTAGEQSTGAAMGNNAHSLSYPVQMAPLFLAAPAQQDSWFSNNNALSDGNTLDQYDFRITLGSGWIADTSNPTLAGYPIIGPASSAVLAFTPIDSFDNFTIWFETFPGSPQYTVNIGGSSLGTLPMNAAAGIGVANFSVSAGTHTINVVSSGAAGGKIFGCEAWLSTSPKIQVFTAGGDSWTAGNWTQNNGNAWDPLAMAEFLAPDLTLVCLGKNEQAQGISQATFEANLRTLVLGLLAAGSPVVIWGPPLSSSTAFGMSEAAQLAYETNMANVAANLGCTFYSLTQKRANWGSFAAANSAGFMFTGDNIHLTPTGYLDVAKALLGVIDSGVGAANEGSDVSAGSGGISVSGSGAIVEPADVVAGSGSTAVSASGAAAEAADQVNASGSTSDSGSGAAAEAHDTVAGTGTVGGAGFGTAIEAADVVAGSGGTSDSGSGSIIEGADQVAGSGSVAGSISGSGAAIENPDTSSGAGATAVSGSGASTEAQDSVAGTGAAGFFGSGSSVEAPDAVAGAGQASDAGSGSAQESNDTVAASGSTNISGSGSVQEGSDSANSGGTPLTIVDPSRLMGASSDGGRMSFGGISGGRFIS